MKYPLFLLVALGLSFTAHAEKGQSIMFGDPDPIYTETAPDTRADDKAEHCKKLKQQMDDLKGKPLRRNPVVNRYQMECVENSDPIRQTE